MASTSCAYVSAVSRSEPCRCMAPLGVPVVPDVYSQNAGESGTVG